MSYEVAQVIDGSDKFPRLVLLVQGLNVPHIELDVTRGYLTLGGELIKGSKLTRTEATFLEQLVSHHDTEVTYESIVRALNPFFSGPLGEEDINTVWVAVSRVRKELSVISQLDAHLVTINGVGYMWQSELADEPEAAHSANL